MTPLASVTSPFVGPSFFTRFTTMPRSSNSSARVAVFTEGLMRSMTLCLIPGGLHGGAFASTAAPVRTAARPPLSVASCFFNAAVSLTFLWLLTRSLRLFPVHGEHRVH